MKTMLLKALGHPLTSSKMDALIKALAVFKKVVIYDPLGQAAEFEALYDISQLKAVNVPPQDIAGLKNTDADAVFITAFDSPPLAAQIQHLLPSGVKVFSFDDARLPDEFLTNPGNYLDSLNFATNFVFFREEEGHHTRLVTADHWAGHSPKNTGLWCCLFGKDGKVLGQWNEKLGGMAQTIIIDSLEVAQRFNVLTFTGSLFIHFTGISGNDTVRYVLDTYGNDDSVLSCTHDADSRPAGLYAGLPAPREGERVLLWVQNSHPCPIPADAVGLNLMGSDRVKTFEKPIPGFATRAIDVADLVPNARWPQQLEVHAGHHFVSPRYEVIDTKGRRLIAQTNIEGIGLKADSVTGKAYILPAPLLPLGRFRNIVLPTPMSTGQQELALSLLVYNGNGQQKGQYSLGKLERGNIKDININALLGKYPEEDFPGGFGHMELVYDLSQCSEVDGWLYALMRYEDTRSGHNSETSFRAQFYGEVPSALGTRLFLRLSREPGTDTLCHLIYPVFTPGHAQSETDLILMDSKGTEVLKKTVNIACSGSLLWRYHEAFSKEERQRAGQDPYIIIRDTTCRLFGYHGLMKGERSFCLDHMFGF